MYTFAYACVCVCLCVAYNSMCNASSASLPSQMSALDASFKRLPVRHVCVYLCVYIYTYVCVLCTVVTRRDAAIVERAPRAVASQSSPHRVFQL